jgi:hypothetical protein
MKRNPFDGGTQARLTRKAVTMKHTPKDRSKAKATPRPGFKKRKR